MLIRRTAYVAALISLELAALVTLHHLGSYEAAAIGWGDLSGWLAQKPPEDALVAVVRLAALALAWWLTASTVLYALASATKIPGLVRGVRWATVAPVRKMIDGALATSILVGSTLAAPSPATAAPADRAAVVVQLNEQPEGTDESPQRAYQPRPAGDEVTAGYTPAPAADIPTPPPTGLGADPPPSNAQPAPQSNKPPAVLSPGTYVVRPGDNLWTIAEQQLAKATGHPVDELGTGEVRSYWLRLLDSNRDRTRSTHPDLIFPREQLELPQAESNQPGAVRRSYPD